ncbi:protein bric-a-brac 2-like isoform X2 [Chrysoperla carnea]|uniref:protein bric-a-brac 2-like isoform X2 n=1 Tax=Chrysoperla carnea TaxID=189513 RepID=UPI001D071365|nr:protein bric-a-brac 2-like isoform X2 [Chrysoperla carnea]
MMCTEQYALRWNNYSNHISGAFDSLRHDDNLVDVTLSCDGGKIRAHKIMLSACSPYFRDLFKENPCQHPIVILRNVSYTDLSAIVSFMYQGEVSVISDQLTSFLQTAELLEVRGLTDSGRESPVLPVEEVDNRCLPPIGDETQQQQVERIPEKFSPNNKKKRRLTNDEQTNVLDGSSVNKLNENASMMENSNENYNYVGEVYGKELIDVSELNQKNTSFITGRTATVTATATATYKRKDETGNVISEQTTETSSTPGPSADQDGKTTTLFPCSKCMKVFRHPNSLRLHLQLHTGGTKCPICAAVMSRKFELKKHMFKKHQITETLI